MKKLLSLTLFLFISFSAFAVKDKKKKEEKPLSKFSLGINFSPDINYRLVKSDGSVIGNFLQKYYDTTEIVKFGYTLGLGFCYEINKHISFETGLQYSNKGFKTKPFEVLIFPQQNDTSYDPILYNLKSLSSTYNFQYLDIPLKVNFIFGNKRVKFIGSSGFVLNFLVGLSKTSELKYLNGETKVTTAQDKTTYKSIRKVNLSPMISAGIDCSLTKHLSLRLEPTFRFGIIKIYNSGVSSYLYNAGLNTSLYWRF